MPLVLGVSFGTRVTSVEVRDADNGDLVATGHEQRAARPLDDEDDPTQWWQSLVVAAGRAGQRDIAAMAVAGARPGLVALDGAGAVLRPARLWTGVDSAADATALLQRIGAARWAERCGTLPTAATLVGQLAWLANHEPTVLERAGSILQPHDWLTYRLAGRLVTDRGSASTTAGWSPTDERWANELLDKLGAPWDQMGWVERLPTVLGPGDVADWLAAPVYELLGLRGRPLVGPGTALPMALALALGLGEGEVAVALDETLSAFTVAPAPTADASGHLDGLADASGLFLPRAGGHGGGGLLDAVASLLGVGEDELGAMALDAAPGAEGLVLVPALGDQAGAVLSGLHSSTTRAQVARAAYEGVACYALECIDALVDGGVAVDLGWLALVGAGAGSVAQAQILADLGGTSVVMPASPGLAAAGACVQAAAVLHGRPTEEVAGAWGLGEGEVIEPRAGIDGDEVRAAFARERSMQERALLNME